MSNSTLGDIRQAIKNLIYRMNGTGIYQTNIPAGHIYSITNVKALQGTGDDSFPKVALVLDGGADKLRVGRGTDKEAVFDIIFFFKKTATRTAEVEDQVDNAVEDFDKALDADRTLAGKATSVSLVEWTTDSGAASPLGVFYARIKVEYRKSF